MKTDIRTDYAPFEKLTFFRSYIYWYDFNPWKYYAVGKFFDYSQLSEAFRVN